MSDFNLNKLVRENVKRMKPYSSARDEFKDFKSNMIYLDANENPFENDVNRYPDPQQRNLKDELAKQKCVSTENILLGNGSDEVLDLIFRAFCNPEKDNVITLPPTYGMYSVLAETNAIKNREVNLDINFQPNVAKILEAVDINTKLLLICSPNNPTGNLFSDDKIEKLVVAFNGIVVIDEAYIDFANADSWLSKIDQYPNLIVTQTLSKAYGLAGIRLGIAFASTKIITILNKIKPPYNVNELTQKRAQQRLISHKTVAQEVDKILEERKKLIIAIEDVDFISKIYPTDANFVLVKVDDANKRYTQLIQKGIVIRNRSTQALCQDTLRFTIGTSEENEKLIKVLKDLPDL